MSRILMGLVAGAVAAFASVWLVETIGHLVYPVQADMSSGNEEQMAALVRGLPRGALAFVVAAWFVGALVGGAVAAIISRRRWTAWLIAALVGLASIMTIFMIPHPEWMQVSALIAPLLGGVVGGHFGRAWRSARASEAGAADAQI